MNMKEGNQNDVQAQSCAERTTTERDKCDK